MAERARFFFYGTLLDGSTNPVARAVHAMLRPLGGATVAGCIFAVPDPRGWYPALLPGDGAVAGRLYEASTGFGAAELARLDAYEDYDPADPAASLYVRETVTARGADHAVISAQAYRYNRPLPDGALPIADGDFGGWLRREGRRAFGGRHGG